MRVPVALGFFFALGVGIIAMALVVALIAGQPPLAPTLPPTETPIALTTPSPTLTLEPTPTPTEVGATPTASGDGTTVGTAIGQRAPDFVLPLLAGGEIDSADSRGKALWVNFMATWCPQCRDELPMMMRMAVDVGEPMDIIVVDVAEDDETVSDFIVSVGVDLPVALDTDASVQQQWAAMALPVHFWIDGDGIVRQFVFGGAPPDVFEDAVRTVVPEATFSNR